MQGHFNIDMATAYIQRRDEELAIDRSRRQAGARHHGPSPGVRERFGISLIHLGIRFLPEASYVRLSRLERV